MIDTRDVDLDNAPSLAAAPLVQVFVRDRDSEGVIRQSLSDLGIHDAQFTVGTVETATAQLAQQPSPRLLIVDVTGVDDPISRMNELAEVCEPNTGVVVIGDRNDITLYRDLKNAGVAEYFFKPLVRDLVTRTCNSILTGSVGRPTARTGKLIYVLGVRGGVGATMIAVNTAWYLAEVRQRWVMLIDLDLHCGDAALQLNTTPSHALREALEHPERVDKLFLERGAIHVSRRLDLLASLEPLDAEIVLTEDAVLSLLENVLQRYRFVFVDLPAAIAARLGKILHMPSTCLLVSNASLVAARDVARWRELIGPNTPDRKTLHILNMNGAYGALPEAEFTRAAGSPPDIVIPYDRELGAASNLGVTATQKSTVLKRSLGRLFRELVGEPVEPPRSIIRRLFG